MDVVVASSTRVHVAVSSITEVDVAVSSITDEDVGISSSTEVNVGVSRSTEVNAGVSSSTEEDVASSSITEVDVAVSSSTDEDVSVTSIREVDAAVSSSTDEDVAVSNSTEVDVANVHEDDESDTLQSTSQDIRIIELGGATEQHFSSPRIQSMARHRSEFSSALDFQIESSKAHWTEMSPEVGCKPLCKRGLVRKGFGGFRLLGRKLEPRIPLPYSEERNREMFQQLKGARDSVFRDFHNLELGEKIAEGGQADIYEGICSNISVGEYSGPECIVKIFKGKLDLQVLQSQWPSKVYRKIRDSYSCVGTSEILGATLLEDGKCAFVLQRYWGDLRTLIDNKMLETGNRHPPFQESVAVRILWQIARGMDTLHKNNILHRDLKASNVLVNMYSQYSQGYHPEYPDCYVADFECSVGVVGTRFWRAPEILRALDEGLRASDIAATVCTKMSDVYSYGMLCYEVLTGRLPFEEADCWEYDAVLSGRRPELPAVHKKIRDMVRACWDADPGKRPSFKSICCTIEDTVNNGLGYQWYFLRRWLRENEFPYYGWRGKEQDSSTTRWRLYRFFAGTYRLEFYLVPGSSVGFNITCYVSKATKTTFWKWKVNKVCFLGFDYDSWLETTSKLLLDCDSWLEATPVLLKIMVRSYVQVMYGNEV